MDLFENTVLCKNCGKKMKPAVVIKEGFKMRALKCPSCSNIIIHPIDLEEFNKFKQLRGRQFQVKLRLVGNSYTVSIPREIVNFMKEEEAENRPENIHEKMQEHMVKQMQAMEQMVTLAMEEANKIGLMFNIGENPIINNHNEKPEENKKLKTQRFSKIGGIKIKSEEE
jgi:DNA-directed RNA polymerase subunit RPC12/RpoP